MPDDNHPISELTRSAMTAEELERYAYIHMPEVHPFAEALIDMKGEYEEMEDSLEQEIQELQDTIDKLEKQNGTTL